MKEAIEDYLKLMDSDLQASGVAADGCEVVVRYHRDFLLDFSNTIGDVKPEDLTQAHIAQYAAALDKRNEAMKDVYLDDAREFLKWRTSKGLCRGAPLITGADHSSQPETPRSSPLCA